jgi:hypothetical protein
MTQQEIAFQLGVNQGRVNEVIKRGKWLSDDPEAPEQVAREKALARMDRGVGVKPRAGGRGKRSGKGQEPEGRPKRRNQAQLDLGDL